MRRPDIHLWSVLAAAAAFQVFRAVTRTFGIQDEMWFLQVAKRLAEGETLYRDVYFNTTPLSMYVTAGAVAVTGVQLLTVKLVLACSVLASLLIAWKIVERCVPSGGTSPLLLTAAVLVYGEYPSMTPYTPMAVAFFLLTLLGFVVWLDEPRDRTLFWSGLAAGLSFATKHNVGALAAVALALAVVIAARARRAPLASIVRSLAVAGAGFSIVAGAMVLVIAATGGLPGFVEYAFLNKTTYVTAGAQGYVREMMLLLEAARRPLSGESAKTLFLNLVLAVPVLALVLSGWWLIASKGEQKVRAAALAVFLVTGIAATYPRAGSSMAYVVPILGTISGIAWRLGGAPRNRVLRAVCVGVVALWLSIGLASLLVSSMQRLSSPEWRFSRIAHCRGILVETERDESLLAQARQLRAAVPAGEAFIESLAAGFHYLAAGIRNPTPYDFPAVTTFGPRGQQKVIAWIEEGRIETVAVFPHEPRWQTPWELLHAIQTTMTPRTRSDDFIVYSRRE